MHSKVSYHHGDLRRALLDAALEIVRSTGSEEFTLREVARRAGVSHNAPYRHFKDKADLIAAVATEGYNHLTASMKKAMSSGNSAYERFSATAEGFLRFALRYPDHFKLIFDLPRRYEYPETYEAGERAFGMLISAIEHCQAEGILQKGNSRMLALMFLGVAVGNAKLAITDRLPFAETLKIVAFDKSVKDALFRGLAPESPQEPSAVRRSGKKSSARAEAKKRAKSQKPHKP